MSHEDRREGPLLPSWALLLLAGFVLSVHGAWWLSAGGAILQGTLADGDSYARLIRVQHLIQTGGWFDTTFPGSNAPYGDSFHWTRPFDLLLMAGALPLLPWFEFDQALYMAGAFISPVLHICTALALAWAAAPVLGRWLAGLAGGLTALQIGMMSYAVAGRADHHMLFALLLVLAFGFTVRALNGNTLNGGALNGGTGGRRQAAAAGLCLALGIWVGPEMIIYLGLTLVVLGLAWLVDGGPAWRRRNLHLSAALAVGLAVFVGIERGPGHFLDVEYDRISIVHVTLALLITGFWLSQWRSPATLAGRLAAAVAGMAVTGGLMAVLFPALGQGPWAGLDGDALPYFKLANEYQSVTDLPRLGAFFGTALASAPWLIERVAGAWRGTNRWAWLLIGLGFFLYLTFGISWGRWSLYGAIFMALALAGLLGAVAEYLTARLSRLWRAPAMALAFLLLVAGPPAAGLGALGKKNPVRAWDADCGLGGIAQFLNGPAFPTDGRIILASPAFGPEILYRTGHRIMGTLLHRNSRAMLDSVAILGGTDGADIKRRLRARGVDLILLCRDRPSNSFFTLGAPRESLYVSLRRAAPPPWLGEIVLPPSLAKNFHLYQVRLPATP